MERQDIPFVGTIAGTEIIRKQMSCSRWRNIKGRKIVSLRNLENFIDILDLPLPKSRLFCKLFEGKGNKQCLDCPDEIPCVRIIEAELTKEWREKYGKDFIPKSKYDKEEEKEAMEKYFRFAGVKREAKVVYWEPKSKRIPKKESGDRCTTYTAM